LQRCARTEPVTAQQTSGCIGLTRPTQSRLSATARARPSNTLVTVEGAPPGASASPLLANVYLHHFFDLWVDWWRRRHAHGDVIIMRFADLCRARHRSAYADHPHANTPAHRVKRAVEPRS
jgi:hypothetical protein